VNVKILEQPGVGRYTVAARDIKEGDVLAAIPPELCFAHGPGETDEIAAVRLLAELQDPNSKFKPHLATLPRKGQTRSLVTVPDTYLPLIQHSGLEKNVMKIKENMRRFWESHQDGLISVPVPDNVTLRDLEYALDLFNNRMFDNGDEGGIMLPVLDMANHYNNCPHTIHGPEDTPCKPGSKDLCVIWRAEADVSAGEEVCYAYLSYMLQDSSLLQYGFLQGGDVANEMSGVDLPGVDPTAVWELQEEGKNAPFTGSEEELIEEQARLRRLYTRLEYVDRKFRPIIQPDPDLDADGSFLEQMWEWRRQRMAAISKEIIRIDELLHGNESSADTASCVAPDEQDDDWDDEQDDDLDGLAVFHET
jgi:hypothetical protein